MLYFVLLYTQALYNHMGGGGVTPPVCSIHLDDAMAAIGQRRQCTHHTPATGQRRESHRANQVDGGLLGGHD